MRLVVLGAAESGVGAAILAQKQGYDVFVSDRGQIQPRYKQMLDAHGICWEEGQHTENLILSADEVVKSPGIPETVPMVAQLLAQGTPILSEIEFAARYTDARMIAITGSNGKTTTTSLIYHLLRLAGEDVGLAGNIGHSLALQVAESPHSTYVIELSSFQLDNMYDFRANIAVLLNITPDHLDRYDFCMQNMQSQRCVLLRISNPLIPSSIGAKTSMYPQNWPNILMQRSSVDLQTLLRWVLRVMLKVIASSFSAQCRSACP